MRNCSHAEQNRTNKLVLSKLDEKNTGQLNLDIRSYQFHDLDLAMAAEKLTHRDQRILILHLMGHTQHNIAAVFSLSRSMISKRLTAITKELKAQWGQNAGDEDLEF